MLTTLEPAATPAIASICINAGGLSLTLTAATSATAAEGLAHLLEVRPSDRGLHLSLAAALAQSMGARHEAIVQAHRQCLEEIYLALLTPVFDKLSTQSSAAEVGI